MTDDLLLQYITEAKKIPLLSEKDERNFLLEAKKGNPVAIEKLINSNLRLVIKMANQYSNNTSEIMDLIQEGNLGLMKAVEMFDCSHKVKFSSYAVWWIRQAFNKYLNSKKRMIRLPVRKERFIRELQKEEDLFESEYGRSPSCEELSKILKRPYKQILEIKNLQNYNTFSLDMPLSEDDGHNIYDLLPSYQYSPENEFIENEFKQNIDECLGILNEREKDIVKNRYGLDGIKTTLPFHVLAKKYSISAESVRQTQLRAIRKLKADETVVKTMSAMI